MTEELSHLTYDQARTRKIAADAELAEMELAKARREFISVEDVRSAWQNVLSNMRARLLSMPSTVAPIVQHETNLGTVKDIIDGAIRECLEELSSYDPGTDNRGTDRIGGGDPSIYVDPKTTAKTNSKRMGRPRKATKL